MIGEVLSHYHITGKLGAGGMGEVYLAEDTKLDRKVALKILPADLAANQDRLRRFVLEAKAAAALSHPNIAHIYEIGDTDGSHFIAMEYVEGETLREKIRRGKSELKVVLKDLLQVAEGLAKAHAAGIVHRDLKPENIMVTRDGYAKILDFGLAKLLEKVKLQSDAEMSEAATAVMPAQLSSAGVVMGTACYMSPEQARGQSVDQRSDIFSFGCILYEAAAGRRPFDADSVFDTLHKIIYDPAPSISDLNPSAPHGLQRIVRKCLAKDPNKRYQTIRDVGNDLEEVLGELEDTSDFERLPPPPDNATSGGDIKSTDADRATDNYRSVTHQRASSAEYVLTGIRRHKGAVTVALALLITSAAGAYFYLARGGGAAIDSIAVLPLLNAENDPGMEYLSDGISESLINSLTELQRLRVVARTTAFRYKGRDIDPQAVGRELNVRAVLMGRVRQLGDVLDIQVDLVDASTGAQLWGEEYNREISGVLAVKQDIAREITEKLRLRLSGEERKHLTGRDTTNAQAYQFYLRGRHHWNKRTADGINRAIGEFQKAIEYDPAYALGYVGLADCYTLLEENAGVPASESLPKARAAVDRALQIDDYLAEAHTSSAMIYQHQWRWTDAEAEYRRAISLNPNYPTAHQWYSNYLFATRRFDDALKEGKRAQELDPLAPIISHNVAFVYLLMNDFDSAIEESKRILELAPSFPPSLNDLGWAYLKQRRYDEATAQFQKAVESSDRASASLSNLGYCYAVTGRRAEALEVLNELEQRYGKGESIGTFVAGVYTGLGDKDHALALLERDFQQHSGQLPTIVFWISLWDLRSDPRYADLVRRMGLEP